MRVTTAADAARQIARPDAESPRSGFSRRSRPAHRVRRKAGRMRKLSIGIQWTGTNTDQVIR
jgi:hypothetical protein